MTLSKQTGRMGEISTYDAAYEGSRVEGIQREHDDNLNKERVVQKSNFCLLIYIFK